MADPFIPDPHHPGLYYPNASTVEDPAGSHRYSTSALVEDPTGSHRYVFASSAAWPPPALTVSLNPPSAHLVWEGADLPPETEMLTVTRTVEGVSSVVRGGRALFAAGGAVLDDWEAPVGAECTWAAEAFDGDGASLGLVAGVSATITSDASMGWVSDPTTPRDVVQVELAGDAFSTLSKVRQVQTYQVGNRVVALLGALGKLTNLTLRMRTTSKADTDLLRSILYRTTVLIRTAPPAAVPRLLYVVVPQVDEVGLDVQWGGTRTEWPIQGDEVDASTLDILVPQVSWQTYMDAFPDATWQDVMDAYGAGATWLDVIKAPPGGGV